VSRRLYIAGLLVVVAAYLHNTLPFLTMMPRVNVDEPWLIERAYQVLHTGRPSQPMLGLAQAYLLQPGYGYLVAPWIGLFGVGIFQARLLAVILGLGTVLSIAAIGRRLASDGAGLFAAAFLLSDSNFLGGARMARTDIPAVFFIALSFLLFLIGRERQRATWYAASGMSTAAAILCHGNSFWAAVILGLWYAMDNGPAMFRRPYGYAYAAGLLGALAPYLIVAMSHRHELSVQIARFAGDRVPGWRPSFLLEQIRLEPLRYHDWYFGLVTDTVRNPVLRVFQIAIVCGFGYAGIAWLSSRASDERRSMAMVFVWAAGAAAIFAAFINNKALVYLPHVLLGFAVIAGVFTAWICGVLATALKPRYTAGAIAFALLLAHTIAGAAYYEKWYALTRRTELLPYESTARTIKHLLPAGPKYVYGAAQFWIPFAEEKGVAFFSHAAPGPSPAGDHLWPAGASDGRPLFLLIDERQWEPELVSPTGGREWQSSWIAFIESQCRLRSYAPGTAYGTLAAYECGRSGPPPEQPVFIAASSGTYEVDRTVFAAQRQAIAAWSTSVEPKFPGIEHTVTVRPGHPYLLTAQVDAKPSQDLVYVGRWSPPEVTSLSGGSSGGIVEPASRPAWFPGGHAFVATSPAVRVLFYTEQPPVSFTVNAVVLSSLRLREQ
jgi:4-amino-4-deoxy-L-arabinose transferase-like glycosyltransferase